MKNPRVGSLERLQRDESAGTTLLLYRSERGAGGRALGHGTLYRRPKGFPPILQDVVVRPGPHRFHGGFFTNSSRHDDEGDLESKTAIQLQCLQPAEVRQNPI